MNACVLWDCEDDCAWAKYLLDKYINDIDLSYLKKRAEKEKVIGKLEDILRSRRENEKKRNYTEP